MKYIIAAVPFSDNLGDGVIADNIKDLLLRNTKCEVELCDISYRNQVSSFSSKDTTLNLFLKIPEIIRKIIVLFFFTCKYLKVGRSYFNNKLINSDVLLIGGGQLISDVDLNFPLKLFFLIKHAEKYNIPTKIISVGVASKWSYIGQKLINRVLGSKVIKGISVRDELSKNNLIKFFNKSPDFILADPALMCKNNRFYKYHNSSEKHVGLGVSDLAGLNHSSDILNSEEDNSLNDLVSIVKKLSQYHYKVILFTNGAIEDEHYLHNKVIPRLRNELLPFKSKEQFHNAKELVEFISSLDILFAYRLHANIIASSYNIPYFSVAWDNKILSFFSQQKRQYAAFKSLNDLNKNMDNILNNQLSKIKVNPIDIENQYINYLELKS